MVRGIGSTVFFAVSLAACGPASTSSSGPPAAASAAAVPATPGKVTAFAVSNDNLRVDKVGMRDGELGPDGSPDLVFTATIDGPFRAIFIYESNEKGEPAAGLRADTVIGTRDIPPELGSVVDEGKMTLGIGVYENGKVLNEPTGTAHADAGIHQLTLYVPDNASLKAGDFVRIWIRSGGKTVAGPIAKY